MKRLTQEQTKAKNIDNALADTIADMERGDFMVYYEGKAGVMPSHIRKATREKAFLSKVRLFSKPRSPAHDDNRIWDYMAQKV